MSAGTQVKAHYDDFDWTPPAELEELAQGEELWPSYLETAVYLDGTKLKGTVRPVRERGEQDPPMGSLHVLAAVQPWAEPDSEDSRARILVLTTFLVKERIDFIGAVGSSFDGSYSEESRALFGLSDDEAREIGKKFGQVAIFAWNGPNWLLRATVGSRQTCSPWRWQPVSPNPS